MYSQLKDLLDQNTITNGLDQKLASPVYQLIKQTDLAIPWNSRGKLNVQLFKLANRLVLRIERQVARDILALMDFHTTPVGFWDDEDETDDEEKDASAVRTQRFTLIWPRVWKRNNTPAQAFTETRVMRGTAEEIHEDLNNWMENIRDQYSGGMDYIGEPIIESDDPTFMGPDDVVGSDDEIDDILADMMRQYYFSYSDDGTSKNDSPNCAMAYIMDKLSKQKRCGCRGLLTKEHLIKVGKPEQNLLYCDPATAFHMTVSHIKNIAIHIGRQMVALDNFGNVIDYHLTNHPARSKRDLAFKCANNHLYPIVERQSFRLAFRRARCASTHKAGLRFLDVYAPHDKKKKKTLRWNVHTEIKRSPGGKRLPMVLPDELGPSRVLCCAETKDFHDEMLDMFFAKKLAPRVLASHNGFISTCMMGDNVMKRVENPKLAEAFCSKFKIEYRGQSPQTIIFSELIAKYPDKFSRTMYSPSVLDAIDDDRLSMAAPVYCYNNIKEVDDFTSIDMDRHYENTVRELAAADIKVPIITEQSQVYALPDFDPENLIPRAFYYITNVGMFPFHGEGWYAGPMIQQVVASGFTSFKVTHMISCHRVFDAELLVEIFDQIIEIAGHEDSKDLIRKVIGLFGRHKSTNEEIFFATNQSAVARAMGVHHESRVLVETVNQSKYADVDPTFVPIPDLIKITIRSESEKIFHQQSTYKSIVDMARARIWSVYVQLNQPKLTAVCTDSLTFHKSIAPTALLPGSKFETVKRSQDAKHTMNKICPGKPPVVVPQEWCDYQIEDIPKLIEADESFLITGEAGTGKTYTMQNTVIPALEAKNMDYAMLCPTNAAKVVIDPKYSPETIHKWLGMDTKTGLLHESKVNLMHQLQTIIMDEVFMQSAACRQAMIALSRIRLIRGKSHHQHIMVGDPEQLAPVGDDPNEDLLDDGYIKEMANCNRVQLSVGDKSRCDREIYKLGNRILHHNDVSLSGVERTLEFNPEFMYVCYTNRHRKAINIKCMKLALAGYNGPTMKCVLNPPGTSWDMTQCDMCQDMTLFVGMRVITRIGVEDIQLNNERWIVTEVADDHVVIKSIMRAGVEREMSHLSIYRCKLCPAYAMTLYGLQAQTVNRVSVLADYNWISRNLSHRALRRYLYTWITRSRKMDNLRVLGKPETRSMKNEIM